MSKPAKSMSIPDRLESIHINICGAINQIDYLATALKVRIPAHWPANVPEELLARLPKRTENQKSQILRTFNSAVALQLSVEKKFDAELRRYFAAAYLEISKAAQKFAPPTFWGWYSEITGEVPSLHAAALRWARRHLFSLTDWLIDESFPYSGETYDEAKVLENIREFEPEVDEWCDDVLKTSDEIKTELAILGIEGIQAQMLWNSLPKLSPHLLPLPPMASFLLGDNPPEPILVNSNDDRDRFAYDMAADGKTDKEIADAILKMFQIEIGPRGVGAAVKRFSDRNNLPGIARTRGKKPRKPPER